jgi:hypothetical protein
MFSRKHTPLVARLGNPASHAASQIMPRYLRGNAYNNFGYRRAVCQGHIGSTTRPYATPLRAVLANARGQQKHRAYLRHLAHTPNNLAKWQPLVYMAWGYALPHVGYIR